MYLLNPIPKDHAFSDIYCRFSYRWFYALLCCLMSLSLKWACFFLFNARARFAHKHSLWFLYEKEILGGKYEFVLTTHIDKGHIHNHLIFNAVSFIDHKHYHSNKPNYHKIRQAKGKSYTEHQAVQNGTSYKAKLQTIIDRLTPVSPSLKDLIARLQREGQAYSEQHQGPAVCWLSTVGDIENLKRAATTITFLPEHGTGSYEKLVERCDAVTTASIRTEESLRDTEQRIADLALLRTYRKLKPVYDRYKASKDKEKFLRGFERKFILLEAADREIKKARLTKLPSSDKLKAELDGLTARKTVLQAELRKI